VDPVPQAPVARRLDRNLTAILDGRYAPDDVVIADAKDADTAFGGAGPGTPGHYRTRGDYLDALRALIAQG
jgi:hypothetical protein